MKTVTIRLLTFSLFVLVAVTANGQTSTPQATLDQFLKLDFDGARLDSDGFKQILPLTVWKDSPGFDSTIVVRGYKAGEPSIQGNRAKILVTYDVVGMIGGNTMWEAYEGNSPAESFKDQVRISYNLVLRNGRWKVEGPNELPHVSIAVTLKNEEELLADKTRDPEEHKAY